MAPRRLLPRECPHCCKIFKTGWRLKLHLVCHETDAQVKCDICKKVLKNPVVLKTHVRVSHINQEKYGCPICPREFMIAANLKRHVDALHSKIPEPRFPCKFTGCQKTFKNKASAWSHFNVDHAVNPVRFRCSLCSREFKAKGNLNRHIVSHTTEKAFKCATCEKGYQQKCELVKHQATHQAKWVRLLLNCPSCPRTFLDKSGLLRHFKDHHVNERNYPCRKCGKILKTGDGLKMHVMAEHSTTPGKLQHSCSRCEYTSFHKSVVRTHVKRVHFGVVGKNECYFCGKRFFAFSQLVAHCNWRHTMDTNRKFGMYKSLSSK
ncbi:zinc finger protein 37-like isoform X1 [Folsomia candida]|uniref:zinc finger protein 37-like isoform X1 n=1 Tax=Folsomia candida TaxID=158441 RepID=UPI001604DA91|nr:zinc finger protein 37-like isoform X1 [Folsomia candida]